MKNHVVVGGEKCLADSLFRLSRLCLASLALLPQGWWEQLVSARRHTYIYRLWVWSRRCKVWGFKEGFMCLKACKSNKKKNNI